MQFPTPHQRKELARFWSDPDILAHLAQPHEVVEDFDIPDLAGYSTNGRRLFVDRHLAQARPDIAGMPYEQWIQVLVGVDLKVNRCGHEPAEKAAIDVWGYAYTAAHEDIAEPNEHEFAKGIGLDWPAYVRELKPWIKRAEHELIERPPPDLDCRPYYDDPDADDIRILRRLAGLGVIDAQHPMVAASGAKRGKDGNWYVPDHERPGKHRQFRHDGTGDAHHGIEPPVPGARLAHDGEHYVPDPEREGKFLRVRA